MKAKAKEREIFFVKEMPDDYEIDLVNSKPITKRQLAQLLKDSKKKPHVKKAS